jgi:hypothetical protein
MDAFTRELVRRRAGARCEYCGLHEDDDPLLKFHVEHIVAKQHTRLFHPRQHKWSWHFRWKGAILVGRTAIGRTTVAVLSMNLPHRVALREALIATGRFPPP